MVGKLYQNSFEILIRLFIPLLLIRYHLLFAVHVDLNSKIVIDSHLILTIVLFFISLKFDTRAEDVNRF